jgi:hypothetical protein
MANLAAANQWYRPGPGRPKVFLSFHYEHQSRATEIKAALEAAEITVIAYDPNRRWPDGPLEMLRKIVTECHCVVYVGPRAATSRYVHFELRIAREFGIEVIRMWSSRQIVRGIQRIFLESAKTHTPDLLWGLTVSGAITRACDELTSSDIASSDVNMTGRTGLDVFGREYGRKLRETLPFAIAAPTGRRFVVPVIAIIIIIVLALALLHVVL